MINARIGFKPQVAGEPGLHSLYDWCYKTMWLGSDVPKDPEDETGMEMHCADALYSAVQSLRHAIQTEDHNTQQDAAHQMIKIAMPLMIKRGSESKLATGRPPVGILK